MAELHVVATIPAAPEHVEPLRAALRTLVEATRQEEGCLAYDLYESASAPGVFVTVERWTGQEALDAHMASPHIAAAMGAAQGALAGDIAIHPLVPVDAG
ncbi:antibiotic biosynthesis monooxygenase [Phycicoccus sp. MAQZ13P-2]|uniref:putative quinol monooxygenase n=1 Tax=Phycicoccus TaxID=367298 RepID=UPI0004C39BA4|nr:MULTISPECIES: putative quinol monooxygenase [Phycicoccus]MBT9256249.1 antibiotic biosynthesis monooxygenase [Phycicoccus mangrovi]MBT9273736.1 antibiotic biosynthesis monooxygenase [Phycicoccus mangrovi]GIL36592.1 antibiotic biosynthesis monooxygenase [Phycicoccus sp. DTK01]